MSYKDYISPIYKDAPIQPSVSPPKEKQDWEQHVTPIHKEESFLPELPEINNSQLAQLAADAKSGVEDFFNDPLHNNYIGKLLNQSPHGDQNIPSNFDRTGAQRTIDTLLRLGDLPSLISSYTNPDSALGSFVGHANKMLPLGFGDRRDALRDTISDTLTGNLPDSGQGFLEDVNQAFNANRDLRQLQLQNEANKYPIASHLGSIAGIVPSMIAAPASTAFQTIRNSAALGGLYSLADTKGDIFGDNMTDNLTRTVHSGMLGGLLGTAGSAANKMHSMISPKAGIGELGQIAPSANKYYQTNQLNGNLEGQNYLNAGKKYGILKHEPIPIRGGEALGNTEGSVLGTGKTILTNLLGPRQKPAAPQVEKLGNQLGSEAKSFFQGRREIDYTKAANDTEEALKAIHSHNQFLLKQADKQLGSPKYSTEEVFGFGVNSSKKLNQILNKAEVDLRAGEGNLSEIQYLQALKNQFPSTKDWTLTDISKAKTYLGAAAKFGQDAPPMSPLRELRDAYLNSRQFIYNKLEQSMPPEAWAKYLENDHDMHNLIGLKSMMKEQSIPANKLNEARLAEGPLNSKNTRFTPSGIMDFAARKLVQPGVATALNLVQKSLKPAPNAYMASIFINEQDPTGRLTQKRNLDLARHYIDTNHSLSPLEKAKQIQSLNTLGKFHDANIPEDVKAKALQNQQALG